MFRRRVASGGSPSTFEGRYVPLQTPNFYGLLRPLYCMPSLTNGEEDGQARVELYARVEEVAQPKDVRDQMMVADVVASQATEAVDAGFFKTNPIDRRS
jgi:hypothetical protein